MTPREALAFQAEACRQLGSPFLERLFRLAGSRLDRESAPGRLILDWPGDASPRADSIPLRFSGALHHLVLTGAAPGLVSVFPPHDVAGDTLWNAVELALSEHGQAIVAFMASPPQTNEIRRSAGLVPALHIVAAETGLPLVLSELGCSGGLNLLCDRFHLDTGAAQFGPADSPVRLTTDWTGPVPTPAQLSVASRAGVDLAPFDLSDPADRLRLLAYIWPDQKTRIGNMRAALDLAAPDPPEVQPGDAAAWLESRLNDPRPGRAHVVFHTIAFQYFPAASQGRIEAALKEAGRAASPTAPLARIALENDGTGDGAALTLTTWPGGDVRALGRVDFHGRWVRWNA